MDFTLSERVKLELTPVELLGDLVEVEESRYQTLVKTIAFLGLPLCG